MRAKIDEMPSFQTCCRIYASDMMEPSLAYTFFQLLRRVSQLDDSFRSRPIDSDFGLLAFLVMLPLLLNIILLVLLLKSRFFLKTMGTFSLSKNTALSLMS